MCKKRNAQPTDPAADYRDCRDPLHHRRASPGGTAPAAPAQSGGRHRAGRRRPDGRGGAARRDSTLARHRWPRRRRPVPGRREQRLRQRSVATARARAGSRCRSIDLNASPRLSSCRRCTSHRRRARTWAWRSAARRRPRAPGRCTCRAACRTTSGASPSRPACPGRSRPRTTGQPRRSERHRSTSRPPHPRRARSTQRRSRPRYPTGLAIGRTGTLYVAANLGDALAVVQEPERAPRVRRIRSAPKGGRRTVPVSVRRAGGPGQDRARTRSTCRSGTTTPWRWSIGGAPPGAARISTGSHPSALAVNGSRRAWSW